MHSLLELLMQSTLGCFVAILCTRAYSLRHCRSMLDMRGVLMGGVQWSWSRRYRIVAFDMRGHGETSSNDDLDLSSNTLSAVCLHIPYPSCPANGLTVLPNCTRQMWYLQLETLPLGVQLWTCSLCLTNCCQSTSCTEPGRLARCSALLVQLHHRSDKCRG